MKTSVNTGGLFLPPDQGADGEVKIGAEHGGDSETQGFGVENRVDQPSEGRIIATTPGKTQFAP